MDDIAGIEEIIEEARNGRPFILVDAEGCENEGDVIIPAQFATPDRIAFMAIQPITKRLRTAPQRAEG